MRVGGMLFPPSYSRPQFTDADEAEHDAYVAWREQIDGELWDEDALAFVESLPEATRDV